MPTISDGAVTVVLLIGGILLIALVVTPRGRDAVEVLMGKARVAR